MPSSVARGALTTTDTAGPSPGSSNSGITVSSKSAEPGFNAASSPTAPGPGDELATVCHSAGMA
jgi:hypothetical protein